VDTYAVFLDGCQHARHWCRKPRSPSIFLAALALMLVNWI
jgi:hypothetical protein